VIIVRTLYLHFFLKIVFCIISDCIRLKMDAMALAAGQELHFSARAPQTVRAAKAVAAKRGPGGQRTINSAPVSPRKPGIGTLAPLNLQSQFSSTTAIFPPTTAPTFDMKGDSPDDIKFQALLGAEPDDQLAAESDTEEETATLAAAAAAPFSHRTDDTLLEPEGDQEERPAAEDEDDKAAATANSVIKERPDKVMTILIPLMLFV
jgi:hypothetical protein